MQEACRKPKGFITRNFRQFTFSNLFFSSEGEFKTSATSEMELFVALADRGKPLAQVTWRSIQDITAVLDTLS